MTINFKNTIASFDNPPVRKNTDSLKWLKYSEHDIIPMWVADMDFAAPEAVLEALQHRIKHGVLGYAKPSNSLKETIINATKNDFNWEIKPEWLIFTPGVVSGFNLSCKIMGKAGDGVIVPTPTYPPMLRAPKNNDKIIIRCEMLKKNEQWEFDWQALEASIEPSTCMLLINNPHNPLGKIYSKEELQRLSTFAKKHNLMICSDEIHAGLILSKEKRHIPIASINDDMANRSITLMAPSKTWNIAGLSCSFAIIPNAKLRESFCFAMNDIVPSVNILGLVAAEAAYRHGNAWLHEVTNYLRENAKLVYDTINAIPKLHTTIVEASYLAWIDCRDLGLKNPANFFEEHGVGMSDGSDFGSDGFVRLNFGCSRSLLKEALSKIKSAVDLC